MYVMCWAVHAELTAIYVSARTSETQEAASADLKVARRSTDESVTQLAAWPPVDVEAPVVDQVPAMYRSRHMFAAILAGHRTSVRVGAYFRDEVVTGRLLGSVQCHLAIRLKEHLHCCN